ncbi:MAG: S41 family peptidase [Verrucomicrobiia bacterium]
MNLSRIVLGLVVVWGICLHRPTVLANSLREAVFEAVWGEVNANYYDEDFGGKDWSAIGEAYRSRLQSIENDEAFFELMTELLRELGESHFAIASPSYNDLLPNNWEGGDSGMAVSLVGGRPILKKVVAGSSAYEAGLRAGYQIVSVNGESFTDLKKTVESSGVFENVIPYYLEKSVENRWYGSPGQKVEVIAKSGAMGAPKRYTFKLDAYDGLMSEQLGNLGAMTMEIESRVLESGVAYLRFDVWIPELMGPIRTFVRSLDEDVRGLIIDVRGNPGGIGLMATGLAGMLVDKEFRMGTMRMRSGFLNYNVFPQKGAFLGPVAILIDGSSISTSEIFAASMKETGRARIFGSKSPGAALPSVFKKLPNRYYLQMAIADYETGLKARIEGVGVSPDEEVGLSPSKLRRGEDSVIKAATKWILRQD